MTPASERAHAREVLRLLSGGFDGSAGGGLDWAACAALAVRNAVPVRLGERMSGRGAVPPPVETAAATAGRRARRSLETMRAVGDRCEALGLPWIFPTGLAHWPDVGSDLDLLLLTRAPGTDAAVLEGLEARRLAPRLRERLAGSTSYALPDGAPALDIHHGRLGALGEFGRYPAELVRRSRVRSVDGVVLREPTPEDQLVLLGMRRVTGRRSFRIADVLHAQRLLAVPTLDWDHVVRTTRGMGVLDGLGCFLAYADQIGRDWLDRELLAAEVRRLLPVDGWGRAEFRGGCFRFPPWLVHRRVLTAECGALIAIGDWEGAGRLALLPVLTLAGRRREGGRA